MGKLISNVILAGLAAVVVGLLYVGGYFWVKSGEPMTVAESQMMAPGLTFRDFWASRVEQWQVDDDNSEAIGKWRSCEPAATGATGVRMFLTMLWVFDVQRQGDLEYSRKFVAQFDQYAPDAEYLLEASYLDAVWAIFEGGVWKQLSDHPGTPGGPERNHERRCVTTYPTPADVSANRNQETGALP